MTAVSVDAPAESEALRAQLSLPFSLLCDVERSVIREWDLLNRHERGGIAKPAVFVVDPGRIVRYAAVDAVASRVPAAEIVAVLQHPRDVVEVRRTIHCPRPGDWIRAIRNNFRNKGTET